MSKKKAIVLSVIVIFIIFICCINTVEKLLKQNQFKNNLKKYLTENCIYITDIKFSGEYSLCVDLTMSKEFELLYFNEKTNIIKKLYPQLNKFYEEYKMSVSKIDNHINYVGNGEIKFHIYDYFYEISFVSSEIRKNGAINEYTEKNYLFDTIIEPTLQKNIIDSQKRDYILSFFNAIQDVDICRNITQIEDINLLKKEIIYQYLKLCCEKEEYIGSIKVFSEELSEYKDSQFLFSEMEKYINKVNNTNDYSTKKPSETNRYSKNYDAKDWERYYKYHKYIGYTQSQLINELGSNYYISTTNIVYADGYTTHGLTSSISITFEMKNGKVVKIKYYDQSTDHGFPTYIE